MNGVWIHDPPIIPRVVEEPDDEAMAEYWNILAQHWAEVDRIERKYQQRAERRREKTMQLVLIAITIFSLVMVLAPLFKH